MWVVGQRHAPAALPPIPFCTRGRVGPWTCAENLATSGIGSRAVQPAASRYTDCAIPVRHSTIFFNTCVYMYHYSFFFFRSGTTAIAAVQQQQ